MIQGLILLGIIGAGVKEWQRQPCEAEREHRKLASSESTGPWHCSLSKRGGGGVEFVWDKQWLSPPDPNLCFEALYERPHLCTSWIARAKEIDCLPCALSVGKKKASPSLSLPFIQSFFTFLLFFTFFTICVLLIDKVLIITLFFLFFSEGKIWLWFWKKCLVKRSLITHHSSICNLFDPTVYWQGAKIVKKYHQVFLWV